MVVIIILSILAITAVPKINLQAEAKTAKLEGIEAAIQGVAALVYSKSIVAGNQISFCKYYLI